MSQAHNASELQKKSQQLQEGPLKHIRAAALAAALVPLATVAATPASAQTVCASGGICGVVFDDANGNGVQDASEEGLGLVKVYISDGTDTYPLETDPDGQYTFFLTGGTNATVSVLIPTGYQASPPNVGSDDSIDSDGVPNGGGFSVASVVVDGTAVDFGFVTTAALNPGTGTPGYWKNHPQAWPVNTITVGGVSYTKAQAIAWLGKAGKDKSATMFSSLVPAILNVMIGNDGTCVNATIAAAHAWMATNPVGSNVAASSPAWRSGEPLHQVMDAYNNGLLCAPHRN